MKNFLKLNDEGAVTPPKIIISELESRFPNPINIEWSRKGENYEALFYCDSMEHLAVYTPAGRLVNYRVNLSPSSPPEQVKKSLDPGLEIMNIVVSVSREGRSSYEIIARDSSLTRYLLNISSEGELVEKLVL